MSAGIPAHIPPFSMVAGAQLLEKVLGPKHPTTQKVIQQIVDFVNHTGRTKLAAQWQAKLDKTPATNQSPPATNDNNKASENSKDY